MRTNTTHWAAKIFQYVLLSSAVLYLVVYIVIAFLRLHYPFELEWMEGGSVDQVRRILSGQNLYVRPSLQFVSYAYTPIYYYISAFMSKIIGIGFLPLRLISFISSMACFFIIFLIVKKETGSNFSATLASCLFAATFKISGAWFDIARADSLFMVFVLLAVYLVRFKSSDKSQILAGTVISLSFLTKQTALAIALPLMLYFVLLNRRRAFFFIGSTAVIIGLSTLILNHISDGWYNYYIFYLPSQLSMETKRMFVGFWFRDVISSLPIACFMSIFYLFRQFRNSNKVCYLFYFLLAVGMLGASWAPRLSPGGYANVLIPAYAVISILFGLGIHSAFEFIQFTQSDRRKSMEILICLIGIVQFAALIYNPFQQIPTQKDLEAGKRFINTMAQMKGNILVPFHGYLPTLAGKNSCAQWMFIAEILHCKDKVRDQLYNEMTEVVREKKFDGIILDNSDIFHPDIRKYYRRQGRVFDDKNVFWPVTGMKTRPEFIYVPN